ncbi:hypothetical protein B0919_11515 [Hymenobacter sp. CRA2]|nr:hypothetical protein B0919_11515 [Hymenobacter sp. CRA2]
MSLLGCKSTDKVLFQPSPMALSSRLPSLEVRVDNGPLDSSEGAQPEDAQQLFEREVHMNLTEPEDTARFGTAVLQVQQCRVVRRGRVLQAFQMLTFMAPSVLGVPLEHYEAELQATVQVLNAKGNILGTYSGRGTSRVRVALYHGYSQTQAPRLADVAALREALAQIKPQMEVDAERLRAALLATGPIGGRHTEGTGSIPATPPAIARTGH